MHPLIRLPCLVDLVKTHHNVAFYGVLLPLDADRDARDRDEVVLVPVAHVPAHVVHGDRDHAPVLVHVRVRVLAHDRVPVPFRDLVRAPAHGHDDHVRDLVHVPLFQP